MKMQKQTCIYERKLCKAKFEINKGEVSWKKKPPVLRKKKLT